MPAPQRSAWVRHHQVQAKIYSSTLCLRYPLHIFRLSCRKPPKTTWHCVQQSTGGGVRLFHIQLACACMLLLFLLGLGMRARLLHDWASHGFANEDEYSSSEQILSLFGLVSTRHHHAGSYVLFAPDLVFKCALKLEIGDWHVRTLH